MDGRLGVQEPETCNNRNKICQSEETCNNLRVTVCRVKTPAIETVKCPLILPVGVMCL